MTPDIYEYVETEENFFQTEEIQVGDNWFWNFRDHVQMIFHLKNGVYFTGENNWMRPFKNVLDPLLNLSYWTEDLEAKDVVFFVESKARRVQSFLLKKYHDEIYVREHDLDTLFDDITESDLDYGGVLTMKAKTPEVLPLTTIAFADQTDIMGGPIGFKVSFAPDKLREMEAKGWGDEKNGANTTIEELITLATAEKDVKGLDDAKRNRSTGKNIDVYIVKGALPEHYLKDNDNMEDYIKQVQIVALYTGKNNKKKGVTLYRKKESQVTLLFHTCKEVPGRALGRGEGEALLHPQIWTNFLTIHKTNMLEAGSKVPLYTDDESYKDKNRIQDMENLEITTIEENKRIYQVPTVAPVNVQLIEKSVDEWFQHGQLTGAAFDPILGEQQVSGTTFRGQERTVAQGRGLHDRRRGQRAKYIEKIYREWIIPDIVREILKGKDFLATLTSEEIEWISEQLAENHANRERINAVLDGKEPQDKEELKQEFLLKFAKEGNKLPIEILKDEFRDVEVRLGINIAGKQKDLVGLNDKILSIFQFIFANPQGFQQAMQIPGLASAFQDILEYSGITHTDFTSFVGNIQPQLEAQPSPIQLEQPVNG